MNFDFNGLRIHEVENGKGMELSLGTRIMINIMYVLAFPFVVLDNWLSKQPITSTVKHNE